MKICKKCGSKKDILEFDKNSRSKDGRSTVCMECRRKEMRRIWDEKKRGVFVSKSGMPRLTLEEKILRKEELKLYHKKYRKDNAEIIKQNKKQALNEAKVEGIEVYGGKCSCCGESKKEFLTLEHINGRDKNKRRRTGKMAWLELKIQGWPKNGYTVLCFNCNCAKGAYGSCPHTW